MKYVMLVYCQISPSNPRVCDIYSYIETKVIDGLDVIIDGEYVIESRYQFGYRWGCSITSYKNHITKYGNYIFGKKHGPCFCDYRGDMGYFMGKCHGIFENNCSQITYDFGRRQGAGIHMFSIKSKCSNNNTHRVDLFINEYSRMFRQLSTTNNVHDLSNKLILIECQYHNDKVVGDLTCILYGDSTITFTCSVKDNIISHDSMVFRTAVCYAALVYANDI
jgi:hypothetical protein